MKSLFVLLTALTAGCAMTPADMRQTDPAERVTLERAPMSAASCVARNIENTRDAWYGVHPAFVREGVKPGTAEISVPEILIADFVPIGAGSAATIYVSPVPLTVYKERYIGAFKGC